MGWLLTIALASRRCQLDSIVVGILGTTTVVGAQTAPLRQMEVDVNAASGPVVATASRDGAAQLVYSTTVRIDGAPWIRLRFGAITLGGSRLRGTQAHLRVTSLATGDAQILDAASCRQWNNTSARFAGDAVSLELFAHPNTGPHQVEIASAWIGTATDGGVASICGPTDDRELTNDPRVGRIVPIGCTGWLIDDAEHCFLTAGHCVEAGFQIVEFNVPLSLPDGTLMPPPPEDQYPIDDVSIQFTDTPGPDWCYFGTYVNSNSGLSPGAAQRTHFTLATTIPTPDGSSLRITGYGIDASPPEWNQVEQTDTGTYDSLVLYRIFYDDIDTTPANSGSPIIYEPTGAAIGIHAIGGCDFPPTLTNAGNTLLQPGLQAALAVPVGVCADPCSPSAGACNKPHAGPGCSDAACCQAVCANDPYCCDNSWDDDCASEAVSMCTSADLNGDGVVDATDVGLLLGAWGRCGARCVADLNGDGLVDAADLAILLGAWTG